MYSSLVNSSYICLYCSVCVHCAPDRTSSAHVAAGASTAFACNSNGQGEQTYIYIYIYIYMYMYMYICVYIYIYIYIDVTQQQHTQNKRSGGWTSAERR